MKIETILLFSALLFIGWYGLEKTKQCDRRDELIVSQDSALTFLHDHRITKEDTTAILFYGLTQGVINKHKAKK